MRFTKMAKILAVERLGAGPMPTVDPFLFCVYHKDNYPPGNKAMEAPRRGNGMDFDPHADYRMYHGTKIPGFPQQYVIALCVGLISPHVMFLCLMTFCFLLT